MNVYTNTYIKQSDSLSFSYKTNIHFEIDFLRHVILIDLKRHICRNPKPKIVGSAFT